MLRLHLIERLSLFFTAVATLVTLLAYEQRITLGVVFGGLLATLNFFVLRRILGGILQSESERKQALLGVLLLFKFAIVGMLIFLAMHFLPINGLAIIVGVSLVVLSIFVEGFRSMIRGSAPQSG
ncbi:MAG: ATP synthase subunit I [Pseudomonadota bacterium]